MQELCISLELRRRWRAARAPRTMAPRDSRRVRVRPRCV